MEHQVYVPAPASRLREALADPARVARAVPGLQQDAGADPGSGRLKVRIGSHSITYRGSLRVSPHDDGSYAVDGDAAEARGAGTVKLALTFRLAETGEGCTVTVTGTATADGRVAELPVEAVRAAGTRLLSRFAEGLGEAPAAEPSSVFETEVPPPSLAPEPEPERAVVEEPVSEPVVEPLPEIFAEAAHARRTMIGRSAEEVDHAPPRGRYAPVPAPQTVAGASALRWAAPAAALALASAIVVTRALRRRR
ncbi:SRPBCC family protein [Streptomyces sp. 900105755]|uniref:SRPBCC family protein n=1 Tax=unclassified Streptomyces TaxID=2593676 RepID=UPI000895116A|nr:SRPBCC family protein [Streptomyces sp. Ag109_O5-10]SEE85548.1 Carbon monoxide dehydrogenase subunit G [Streptomyces sp. Ag109_O5-10]